MAGAIRVGIAGWSIPKPRAAAFDGEGSHLERYARRFGCVEINSSFYRPHRPATYARWAAAVPAGFRFAVKLPREVTHQRRLVGVTEVLDRFLGEVAGLGDRLGPVLVQLPPSLAYDPASVGAFLAALRVRFAGQVVCEPRHPSWFEDVVDGVLLAHRIARVAADPAPVPRAAVPGGWLGVTYWRLHGSPEMYYSTYSDPWLDSVAGPLRDAAAQGGEAWCIFDNTALGGATGNALDLIGRL